MTTYNTATTAVTHGPRVGYTITKVIGRPRVGQQWPPRTLGAPKALPRQTKRLAANQDIAGTANGLVAQRGMRLLRVVASAKCRLRFYATDAARAADVNRARGVDPADGAGVLMDLALDATATAPLDFTLGKPVDMHSEEADRHLPFAISTLDASPINLTLDITYQATED